jgi:hypothetical protein
MSVLTLFRNPRPARSIREADLLARSLAGAIREAWERHYVAWSATTALGDERARSAVRSATPELSSLVEALREADDPDEGALQACRRLVCDGFSSPLYSGRSEDLRREAGRLRFCVLAGDGRG